LTVDRVDGSWMGLLLHAQFGPVAKKRPIRGHVYLIFFVIAY
jgi:hypothetical protein